MKTLSGGLLADYQARARTTAWGVLVRRPDFDTSGVQIALTSSDEPATITGVPIAGVASGAVTYTALAGLSASAIDAAIGLDVGNLEATLLDVGLVDRIDILAGRWNGAPWTLFQYAWANPAGGINVIRSGVLGRTTSRTTAFVAELRDWRALAKLNTTEVTQKTCRSELGDPRPYRCQLDLAAYTYTAQVITAVASQRQFTVAGLGLADGLLAEGRAIWTLGDNAGLAVKIRAQVGDVITLDTAMVHAIAVDDEITLVEGCDGVLETCITRFGNARRFVGEPYKPRPSEATRPIFPEDSADFPATNPETPPEPVGGA